MKGGHKLVSAQGESDQSVILVADQSAQRLSIRMLKNRSYITWTDCWKAFVYHIINKIYAV